MTSFNTVWNPQMYPMSSSAHLVLYIAGHWSNKTKLMVQKFKLLLVWKGLGWLLLSPLIFQRKLTAVHLIGNV